MTWTRRGHGEPRADSGRRASSAQRRAVRGVPRRRRRPAPPRPSARDALVHLHLPLVEHCARRFRNRGEPFEDLVQVGTIGLIKSIDRFDTDRGVEFSTYATPTIIGEIKRYFRDKGWAIRVPRRLQELRMQIGARHRRAHPVAGPLPHAARARRAASAARSRRSWRASSPATPTRRSRSTPATTATTGGAVDARRARRRRRRRSSTSRSASRSSRCSSSSPPREKRILLLRFFKNMTQSQIAEEIGVSQMHVSRLLNRTLEQLRDLAERGQLSREPAVRPLGPGVGSSASMLAGCSRPGQHDQRRPRPAPIATSSVVAAPEVPGQPELDQLGQHDRAARPGRHRCRPQAHTSRPTPYARKKTAVVSAHRQPVAAERQLAHARARRAGPDAGQPSTRRPAAAAHRTGVRRRRGRVRVAGVTGRDGAAATRATRSPVRL